MSKTKKAPKAGERIPWPPRKGQRFHVNTGHVENANSYSAIVVAYLADEDIVVFKRWQRHRQSWKFDIESAYWWQLFSKEMLRAGPLPRDSAKFAAPNV